MVRFVQLFGESLSLARIQIVVRKTRGFFAAAVAFRSPQVVRFHRDSERALVGGGHAALYWDGRLHVF